MIQVETTDDTVRVTIPRDEVDSRDIERWLKWMKLKFFSRHSEMAEEEADSMAEEGKEAWWERNKHRFISMEEE